MFETESDKRHQGSLGSHGIHCKDDEIGKSKVTQHNDSNVCIIGTDCIAEELAGYLVKHYLAGGFDFEVKNKLRVAKLSELEDKYLSQESK